ncbi:DUF6531 domain-containing protein, partial [Chitinimonas sp. BJB300]
PHSLLAPFVLFLPRQLASVFFVHFYQLGADTNKSTLSCRVNNSFFFVVVKADGGGYRSYYSGVAVCPKGASFDSNLDSCVIQSQCVAPKINEGNRCVCPKGTIDDGKGGCSEVNDPVNHGGTCPTASNAPAVATCANPIQPGTGNKYQREVDYQGAGANRLAVVRHYNSLAGSWHDANLKALSLSVKVDANFRQAMRADGKVLRFPHAGGADLHGMGYILLVSAEGMQLTTPDNTVENYDLTGRLLRERQRDGYTLTYGYNATGQLTTLTDAAARVLTYTYDAQGRVETLQTPAKQTLRYGYGSAGQLTSVTYPDGKTRQYLYEDSKDSKLLTGIKGEDGVRFATWAYDDKGRAVSSEHGKGLDKVTLTYNTLSATSTSALGLATQYTFQNVKDRVVLKSRTETCPSCTSTTQLFEVDANGRQSKLTDRRGIITQIVSDPSRLLETQRIEAAGTPQARTIATEWHPTFELPAKITEATRRTEFTYDAQGNLTVKTLTKLLDNSSQTWRWSYDAQSRVIDSTDAMGRITRYTYDAAGNLATLTNPAGKVTRYTQYNPDGLPLSITPPDGVVITLGYDLRGRLISQKVGALTTTYSYTPTGLLSSVTTPDGGQLTYTYDDARRLVGVRDKLGNSIRYVLDAMGNRIDEEVRDTSGNLSALTQRIDAELLANTQPIPQAS